MPETINIRLRPALVTELRKRVGDERHASLNGLVNDLCRRYLNSSPSDGTIGLSDLVHNLEESVGTGELWIVVTKGAISRTLALNAPTTIGSYTPYSSINEGDRQVYAGSITKITATTLEIHTLSHLNQPTKCLIARIDLVAWWPIQVTKSDVQMAHLIGKATGRPGVPDHCAVRRETRELFPGLAEIYGFGLTFEESIVIGQFITVQNIAEYGGDPERLDLVPYEIDANTGTQYQLASNPIEEENDPPDAFLIMGIEVQIDPTAPARIRSFHLGGGINLLPLEMSDGIPVEGSLPFHRTYQSTELRAIPRLLYPNTVHAHIEAPKGTRVHAHALIIRMPWNSPLGKTMAYADLQLQEKPEKSIRRAKWQVPEK